MIRAALALYEATGERRYLDRRSPGSARSTATTPIRTTAAISSPPTTPKAWWCARPRPATTPRRTRTRSRRKIWCGSRCSPATMPGASKADRLIDGVLGAARREPVRPCRAAQRARPAAARRRDRGDRSGERADALAAAALKLPFLDRIVLRAPYADALPAAHPAQRQDRGGAGRRGVRLRRRDAARCR